MIKTHLRILSPGLEQPCQVSVHVHLEILRLELVLVEDVADVGVDADAQHQDQEDEREPVVDHLEVGRAGQGLERGIKK